MCFQKRAVVRLICLRRLLTPSILNYCILKEKAIIKPWENMSIISGKVLLCAFVNWVKFNYCEHHSFCCVPIFMSSIKMRYSSKLLCIKYLWIWGNLFEFMLLPHVIYTFVVNTIIRSNVVYCCGRHLATVTWNYSLQSTSCFLAHIIII